VPSMPQPDQPDQPDSSSEEVVLGVDTHKDIHVAAVVSVLGVVQDRGCFPTTTAGYQQLLAWARELGTLRRAGVEGTSSYGAALTRHLRAAGVQVIEVNAPDKTTRRRRGKTDAVDAEAAAHAVLSGRATAAAKAGDGPVEMVRLFKLAKTSATKSRAQAINQLKAVLVRADPPLREALSGLSTPKLIRACVALDAATPTTTVAAAAYTLRLLAGRIRGVRPPHRRPGGCRPRPWARPCQGGPGHSPRGRARRPGAPRPAAGRLSAAVRLATRPDRSVPSACHMRRTSTAPSGQPRSTTPRR
jgi:transposase